MNSLQSFRKLVSDKSFGIEIEVLFHHDMCRPTRDQHYGFFYATTDGSIREGWEHYGIELVSQPLPRQWLEKEITKINRKFPWEQNDSCGIHVHVNRKWCTHTKAIAIAAWLEGNVISHDLQTHLFGRCENTYCHNTLRRTSRYAYVNIQPSATVEFRMFSSGNAAWAIYCLRMVDYLVRNWSILNMDALMAFVELEKPKE